MYQSFSDLLICKNNTIASATFWIYATVYKSVYSVGDKCFVDPLLQSLVSRCYILATVVFTWIWKQFLTTVRSQIFQQNLWNMSYYCSVKKCWVIFCFN